MRWDCRVPKDSRVCRLALTIGPCLQVSNQVLSVTLCDTAGEPSFEFMCLLPLFDPPRHDTKETIDRCREKGISVKMVTGDQLLIGKETARQLGLGTDMYSTEVLLSVRRTLTALSEVVMH